MRPDLEDFDELSAMESTPRSRAMSWLVLAVAVGGFATLAYYAYHSGSQSMRDGALTVVNAEEAPIKTAPVDPQGEQFPNKDKTIYDAISSDGAGRPHVEKLLPQAEQAIIPEESAEDDALTPANAAPVAKPAPSVPANTVPAKPTTATAPATGKKDTDPTTFVKAAPETDSSPSPVEAEDARPPVVGTATVPAMVNVTPATSASKPTSETKDAAAAEKTAKAVAKKAASSAATGAYQLQLGAFKSEAEAQAQWKKISAKFSDTLRGAPVIVKAELPNGTFYRLRTGGFASAAAAKTACATLAASHQACFPVGK